VPFSTKLRQTLTIFLSKNAHETNGALEEMPLNENLLRGISTSGVTLSKVQKLVITSFLEGEDVFVREPMQRMAQFSFAIGILQQINCSLSKCQALILAPSQSQSEDLGNVSQMNYLNLVIYIFLFLAAEQSWSFFKCEEPRMLWRTRNTQRYTKTSTRNAHCNWCP
jgi:hypothetical protein